MFRYETDNFENKALNKDLEALNVWLKVANYP